MSLPPHPAAAAAFQLPPHPSHGAVPPPSSWTTHLPPPTAGAGASLSNSNSSILPPVPPPPSHSSAAASGAPMIITSSGLSNPAKSAVTADADPRGERDPIVFVTPKPGFVLKQPDGTPLLRKAIEHDLLAALFDDPTRAFTPPEELPRPPNWPEGVTKVTFGELYRQSVAWSAKGTKAGREKMLEEPEGFGRGWSMLCLLVNIGKINTTFAFYPEMRTLLRSYHAVPCLQRTASAKKNMQDAPRMKASLKAVLLDHERHAVPFNLSQVERKRTENPRLATSIVNLIFTFISSSAILGQRHLPSPVDFLDLFQSEPHRIPSAQRARAILWLLWRYYEPPPKDGSEPVNPFDDDQARANPGSAPRLDLEGAEEGQENVDTDEEREFGEAMKLAREAHLSKTRTEEEERKTLVAAGIQVPQKKIQGKKRKFPDVSVAGGGSSRSPAPSSAGGGGGDELDEELDALVASDAAAAAARKAARREALMDFDDDDDGSEGDDGPGWAVGGQHDDELEEEEHDDSRRPFPPASAPGVPSLGYQPTQVHHYAPLTSSQGSYAAGGVAGGTGGSGSAAMEVDELEDEIDELGGDEPAPHPSTTAASLSASTKMSPAPSPATAASAPSGTGPPKRAPRNVPPPTLSGPGASVQLGIGRRRSGRSPGFQGEGDGEGESGGEDEIDELESEDEEDGLPAADDETILEEEPEVDEPPPPKKPKRDSRPLRAAWARALETLHAPFEPSDNDEDDEDDLPELRQRVEVARRVRMNQRERDGDLADVKPVEKTEGQQEKLQKSNGVVAPEALAVGDGGAVASKFRLDLSGSIGRNTLEALLN